MYAIKVESAPPNNHILVLPEPPKLGSGQSPDVQAWPPQICSIKGAAAQYFNHSDKILHHDKNVHFRTVPVEEITFEDAIIQNSSIVPRGHTSETQEMTITNCRELLEDIKVNKSMMSEQQQKMLQDIHTNNIRAFNEDLSNGYFDKSNPYEA